jgi:hypothetical protein
LPVFVKLHMPSSCGAGAMRQARRAIDALPPENPQFFYDRDVRRFGRLLIRATRNNVIGGGDP